MYLLVACVLVSVVLMANVVRQWNVPLVIIALGMGIVFGSDITGLIYFDDVELSVEMANAALIFILFASGYGTHKDHMRSVFWPAMSMATVGVAVTAAVTAVVVWKVMHVDWMVAMMLGAVMSSTDAAATLSVLRTRAIKPKLSSVIQIESAANDPMAIILTLALVHWATVGRQSMASVGGHLAWQLVGGVVLGMAVGHLGCAIFNRIKHTDRGYFHILVVGVILMAFGLADALKASGMLAVFFAGFVMGNRAFTCKREVTTFLEAISSVANVGVFIVLGLLAFPSEFGGVWKHGVVLFLVLLIIGRPVAVLLCTALGKYTWKDRVFLGWSGIRGAVPIVLATYPLAADLPNSHDIFNTVFFAVTLSVVIQGSTIGALADWLGLSRKVKEKHVQTMELVTMQQSNLQLVEIVIDEEEYHGQAVVAELGLPAEATITMVNRKETLLAPRGKTVLCAGDVVFVLVSPEMVETVKERVLAAFGRK